MEYNNKYQGQGYYNGSNRQYSEPYVKDDTIGKEDKTGILPALIAGAVIGAVGYKAYKSGAAKNIMKQGIELLAGSKSTLPEVLDSISKWTKNDTIRESTLSIFNKNIGGKDRIKQLANLETGKQTITDTLEDLKKLSARTKERLDKAQRISENVTDFKHTDLAYELGSIKGIVSNVSQKDYANSNVINNLKKQLYGNLYTTRSITESDKLEHFKRKGYRPTVLGDIVELDERTTFLRAKENMPIEVSEEFLGSIRKDLLNNLYETKEEMKISNSWKDVVIDSNILTGEDGNILDLRPKYNNFKNMVTMAASDFHIPLIKLNPLRLLQLDKPFKDPKASYAMLPKHTIQTGITGLNAKNGMPSDFIFMKGNIFQLNENGTINLYDSAHQYKLFMTNSTLFGMNGLDRPVDMLRKISDMPYSKPIEWSKEDGIFRNATGIVSKKLDLFRQDGEIEKFTLFDPMTWFSLPGKKINQWLPGVKSHSNTIKKTEIFGVASNGSTLEGDKLNTYVAIKKGVTLKELFDGDNDKNIKTIVDEVLAGRHDMSNVTTLTMKPYFLINRLMTGLGKVGLGFSTESMGSVQSQVGALLIKRVLPVYLGINAWRYLNYESENLTGEQIEDKMINTAVTVDLGWHKMKDVTGLTDVGKRVNQLMPGLDHFTEIPGLGILDMSKTYEEKKDYWEHGKDPVRKGRYWSMGNTPFTGGKIEYFAPNMKNKIESDYMFTDVKYGSREEYFQNAPIPTLRHPLAPIKHFFTDKYHWEEKHYDDRPYPITSPMFENTPIIGPFLGATIGRVIKPQIKMHQNDEKESDTRTVEYFIKDEYGNNQVLGTFGVPKEMSDGDITSFFKEYYGENQNKSLRDELTASFKIAPKEDNDEVYNKMIYTTPSGVSQIITVPEGITVDDMNWNVKKKAATSYRGVQMYRGEYNSVNAFVEGAKDPTNPNGIINSAQTQFNVSAEVAGIYGFVTKMAVGDSMYDPTMLESSGHMMSMNREFWDKDLGGFGGELSEIARRFIPKRRRDVEYINNIENNMPEWMPGSDYFIDFHKGDPFTKVKLGEARLPGEGYEAVHGITDPLYLGVGSSSLGRSVTDLVLKFKGEDEILDPDIQEILEAGEQIHSKVQRQWAEEGLLIDAEKKIVDKKNDIIGYYDARIVDPTAFNGEAIVDIKSASPRVMEKLRAQNAPKLENQVQVNFYLNQSETDRGYLYYVNREDPDDILVFGFDYDEQMHQNALNNLNTARDIIHTELDNGTINRGDLYDYFDRFKILADVAPYSKEFREYNKLVSQMILDEDQEKEVRMIRDQVSAIKEPMRLYPYRFKTANLKYTDVTVDKIIDNETFLTKEFPNNPIRLAGIDISNDKSKKEYEFNKSMVERYFKPGKRVHLGVDADSLNMINNDTYKTISAVAYDGRKNINRMFLGRGIATEKEDDFSPTGVHARFSPLERTAGSMWERFAHFDSFFNTKFLQVRSGYESYTRRDTFSKDFQTWDDPIRDYVKPSIDKNIDSPIGLITGALVGSLFGRTTAGKIIGTAVGLGVISVGKLYKAGYEAITDSEWIPNRRIKEQEINEYVDTLNFVKHRRLYEEYAHKSLIEDGIDVKEFLGNSDDRGDNNKGRANALKNAKREIKMADNMKTTNKLFERLKLKYGKPNMTVDEAITAINKELQDIMNRRMVEGLPDNALRAIEHYNASEKTMYGYDPGEPIQNILMALPKKDRKYMSYFIDAPEEERMEILKYAPKYMRRPLESIWGIPVEKKTNLEAYFKERQLPGPDWIGWNEGVDLNSVKVKIVRQQNLDPSEFNIWDDDIKAADALGEIQLPNYQRGTRHAEIKSKLYDILHGIGLEELYIEEQVNGQTTDDINIRFTYDKKRELEQYINNHGDRIMRGEY